MPIKPENRARYPKNWSTEIRPAILTRAGHCCEACRVRNYAVAQWVDGKWRLTAGNAYHDQMLYAESFSTAAAVRDSNNEGRAPDESKWVVIVLTIAHLDHTPENCDPSNLRAWCQRCHLAYDAKHHATNSAATRRLKARTPDMFEGATA